jgi:hypothetical protein
MALCRSVGNVKIACIQPIMGSKERIALGISRNAVLNYLTDDKDGTEWPFIWFFSDCNE